MKSTDWNRTSKDSGSEPNTLIDFDSVSYEKIQQSKALGKTEKRRRAEAKLEAQRIKEELGYDISDCFDDED